MAEKPQERKSLTSPKNKKAPPHYGIRQCKKMTKSKIFFVLSLSFLLGIFWASFFRIEQFVLLILVAAGAIVFVLGYRKREAVAAGIALAIFSFGAWWLGAGLEAANRELSNVGEEKKTFTATVIREPEIDEKRQRIVVEDEHRDRILVNAGTHPKYSFGDELRIECKIQPPKNFEDSDFNYEMYLAKEKIFRTCGYPEITVLAKKRGNWVSSFIFSAKSKFEEKLSAVFPEPEGAYLKGLLLGGSRRMPQNVSDAFSRTGTSHTVAVSGYNVTIIAAFLMGAGIFIGLWRQQVFYFALAGIVFFVLMTGAPASAVRAGIMGGLVIWAMKEGRLANSTNAILFAASGMLLFNPLLLRYDAGFQLSFLATIGIVQLSPIFEQFWRKGKAPKLIQETVILTVSATFFVLPIILNSFETLSLVSLPANILILPAIPLIMGTGFTAGILGFVFLPFARIVGFFPFLLLKAEISAVEWLAGLPWAALEVKNFGWAHMAVYYSVLAGAIYLYKRKIKRQALSALN